MSCTENILQLNKTKQEGTSAGDVIISISQCPVPCVSVSGCLLTLCLRGSEGCSSEGSEGINRDSHAWTTNPASKQTDRERLTHSLTHERTHSGSVSSPFWCFSTGSSLRSGISSSWGVIKWICGQRERPGNLTPPPSPPPPDECKNP